jgi:hypothetical protein
VGFSEGERVPRGQMIGEGVQTRKRGMGYQRMSFFCEKMQDMGG